MVRKKIPAVIRSSSERKPQGKPERFQPDTGRKPFRAPGSVPDTSTKIDYSVYSFSHSQKIKILLSGAAGCAFIDFLFYQNPWLMILAIPLDFLLFRWQKTYRIKTRRVRINRQFRDALNSLNVAVQAGYSIENAVSACTRDLSQLYPNGAEILDEFRYIENQLYVSVPIEELLLDLGERTGVEDIENFAAIFQCAKRTGGDMSSIIQKTTRMLGDKIDVRGEIDATLAAKKNEQNIMSLMPAGIILYLRLTSPGFLDVLYGNTLGVAVMSLCLAIYGAAFWLGTRITQIEV